MTSGQFLVLQDHLLPLFGALFVLQNQIRGHQLLSRVRGSAGGDETLFSASSLHATIERIPMSHLTRFGELCLSLDRFRGMKPCKPHDNRRTLPIELIQGDVS